MRQSWTNVITRETEPFTESVCWVRFPSSPSAPWSYSFVVTSFMLLPLAPSPVGSFSVDVKDNTRIDFKEEKGGGKATPVYRAYGPVAAFAI